MAREAKDKDEHGLFAQLGRREENKQKNITQAEAFDLLLFGASTHGCTLDGQGGTLLDATTSKSIQDELQDSGILMSAY